MSAGLVLEARLFFRHPYSRALVTFLGGAAPSLVCTLLPMFCPSRVLFLLHHQAVHTQLLHEIMHVRDSVYPERRRQDNGRHVLLLG